MLSRVLLLAATAVELVSAQKSNILPQDLQAGFADSGVELQVSYTGNAVSGFADGTVFEKDAVAKVPEFALGDSSGISSVRRYTVLMVDTTCDKRVLRYAKTNFKYNFQVVKIESDEQAALRYQAPGASGETGDNRQYSFLMYTQPRNSEISDLKIPQDGAEFDAKQFQAENGFKDPSGGVGMVVKLGGEANCDGGGPVNPNPQAPPQRTGVARPAPSNPPQQEEEAPAPAPSPSSPARTSPPARLTPAIPPAEPTPTEEPEAPETPEEPSTTPSEEESSTTVTSFVSSGTRSPSTLVRTSASPEETEEPSSTRPAPAEQTDNGASGLSGLLGSTSYALVVSVVAISGLLAL